MTMTAELRGAITTQQTINVDEAEAEAIPLNKESKHGQ